ncbi:putative WD domain, G-beta repeat [Lyophyllum shimeji]|uniref:WD domain, G-beta repeat n=1 Tax=Lyophyllum shimeji TaxID=47721 RepID=A0A9P3UIN1_LYOSH|nr:putative WD domain, G-beta repeat [Lyophyllum shimeji]
MQTDWDVQMEEEDEGQMPNGYPGQNASIQEILSTLFSMQAGGGPQANRDGRRTIRLSGIDIHDLTQLLTSAGVRRRGPDFALNEEDLEEEEEDDEDDGYYNAYRAAANVQWRGPQITEPQKAGVELLNSGDFGRVANKSRSRRNDTNIANLIVNRAKRPQPRMYKEDYANNLIPNSNGTAIAAYDANIYTGQYSADSSFYYTCSQDFRLHVFDTTAPPIPHSGRGTTRIYSDASLQTTMKVRRSIQGNPGRWTITDANLSPDNERMIYSSITPTVYMTNILDDSPVQTPIPFADPSRSANIWGHGESFGIWSCRFSADGNEVVAGGSGKIFVYDLLANRRTVKISAHKDDVNSCCWADTASGNVLVSASDDTFIKVWDRRSLGASQKPSGVLIGHTEGITYVSAKGDGRYIVSNGKDQAMRLWDLRKMRSSQEFETVERKHYGVHNFDYRYPHYPGPRYPAHPLDCSVMTYYGHSVLRTLIRCHFSPMETTGARYLYSGSADGRIHIWSLDGRVVQVLDRSKTLPMSFDPSEPEYPMTKDRRSAVCVRDVSWHAQEPALMSVAWESAHGGSTVAKHEWKGLSKMRGALEDWVEKDNQEQQETSRLRRSARLSNRRTAQRHVPGAFEDEEEE